MSMMMEILENQMIQRIAGNFCQPPNRLNQINEADAELIDLGKETEKYLALTTDALGEEIATGLYDDPYLKGWMLATINFSDLAAVGAEPLGLLVAINYSSKKGDADVSQLAKGISDACQQLNTFVLGGDTNQSEQLFLAGCAVGLVPKESVICRIGAKPGDKVYLSGPAGIGNIFAFLRFSRPDLKLPRSFYQPLARIKEGIIIRQFASCCMDTSDAILHTVDTLMRLNHCRFVLDDNWDKVLHPAALDVCRAQRLPEWLTLAGVHGEFELCFTVNPQKESHFLSKAAAADWTPIPIGEIREGEGVAIKTAGRLIPIETALIRNLAAQAGSDQQSYIRQLFEIARQVGI